jgi:hypothetical protein
MRNTDREKLQTISVLNNTARSNPAIVPGPVFDLSAAISSGVINEQQLITVLTEMCRCVLADQPAGDTHSVPTDDGPETKLLTI